MWGLPEQRYNPNPITKLLVVLLLGCLITKRVNPYFELTIVAVISVLFWVNGFQKKAIKNLLFFCLLFGLSFVSMEKAPLAVQLIVSMLMIIRLFYLPFAAGALMITTSDVGRILSSLDKLKVPSAFSVPIAVMFRFFPAFREERHHLKMAMKIRGIQTFNPILYFKYVSVPLLVISSNIADHIAKAAETKCIANPIQKQRYVQINLKPVDVIYLAMMVVLVVGGLQC